MFLGFSALVSASLRLCDEEHGLFGSGFNVSGLCLPGDMFYTISAISSAGCSTAVRYSISGSNSVHTVSSAIFS